MKRRIIVVASTIIIALAILFAYQYQKPVLTSGEAILKAASYLQDPPEGYDERLTLRTNPMDLNIEDIDISLTIKSGFFSELMNRREWHVTIHYDGMIPTVVIDAITGEYIMIYGPVS